MKTHDKLLTNTTNRLSWSHEEKSAILGNSKPHILMPTPIHHSKELPFLAKRQAFLEQQIEQAKQEHRKMLEMFEQIGKIEKGQSKYTKKLHRRCNKDILQKTVCPYTNCNRFYSTQDTLSRHIKLKHKIVKHEAPEPYCDLPPWPNLSDEEDSQKPPDKNSSPSSAQSKTSDLQ